MNQALIRRIDDNAISFWNTENRERLLIGGKMTGDNTNPATSSNAEERASAPGVSAANLRVIEEPDASGEVADLFERYRQHFDRPAVPGILKCFATHPAVLRHMMGLAESFLFVDGHLTRRQKEAIATLVSTENQCLYCADSHGYFLRNLGGTPDQLAALRTCDLRSAVFSPDEAALLEFVRKVTKDSHSISREDVVPLLAAGWNELQIAEAIHVAALFAAFNRIVSSFGVPSQNLLASV